MALSKRLRFEVFRRDNHTCRYCGATAPDVKLTVDHVTPQVLGGTDDPTNLVTACQDCNSGKSSSSPDAIHVADVEQDAIRWAQANKRAAELQRAKGQESESLAEGLWHAWSDAFAGFSVYIDDERAWHRSDWPDRKYPLAVVREDGRGGEEALELFDTRRKAEDWLADYRARAVPPMDDQWKSSVRTWHLNGIDLSDLSRAVEITAKATHVAHNAKFRYFCGVIWNMVSERQKIARQLIEASK